VDGYGSPETETSQFLRNKTKIKWSINKTETKKNGRAPNQGTN